MTNNFINEPSAASQPGKGLTTFHDNNDNDDDND